MAKPPPIVTVGMVKDRPTLHRWVGHLLRQRLGRDPDDSALGLLTRLLANDDARLELKDLLEEVEQRKNAL